MTSLVEKLKRNNIRLVFCIDDDNAAPIVDNAEKLVELFLKAAPRKARALAEADERFSPLSTERCGFGQDDSPEERRAALEPLALELFESGAVDSDAMKQAVAILCPDPKGVIQEKLKPLFRVDGIEFRAMTFSDWHKSGENIIRGANEAERILLLVDETNDHEPEVAHMDGTAVLAGVFSDEKADVKAIDCIVVTNSCNASSEMDESHKAYAEVKKRIAPEIDNSRARKVFVLSKERLNQDGLDKEFGIHIDRLEAARLGDELTTVAQDTLVSAIKESAGWLREISLPEFHSSVFVSSRNEGAAEIDTLIRLVSIRQRVALERKLRDDIRLRQLIENMRTLSASSFEVETASKDRLKELRIEEFERRGDSINALMAPIACGDVFGMTMDGSEKEIDVMLLANPCDLVLRENGKRKLNTGLIVRIFQGTRGEVRKKQEEESAQGSLLYAIYSGSGDEARSYLFFNSKVEAIPLAVLDLCWANRDGKARLDVENSNDTHSIPQQARLKVLRERLSPMAYPDIELWGARLGAQRKLMKHEGGDTPQIEYAISRKWRLAPEFSAAALSALAQTLARPAFGHDYTH